MNKVVYFCDRCGKEFNINDYGIIKTKKHYKRIFPLGDFNSEAEYELCPECWKSFEEWLNYRYNNENIGV